MRQVYFVCLVCMWCQSLWAYPRPELGVSLLYRHYSEHATTPSFKSDEFGLLRFAYMGLVAFERDSVYYKMLVGIGQGNTLYDGGIYVLQGDTLRSYPLKNRTHNMMSAYQVLLGYTFGLPGATLTPYLGMAGDTWRRDIRSSPEREEYKWFSVIAGGLYRHQLTADCAYGLRIQLQRMYTATMAIDNISYTLGNRLHVNIGQPWFFDGKHVYCHQLVVEPYYSYQRLGESNKQYLETLNLITWEPESITHSVGVRLSLIF